MNENLKKVEKMKLERVKKALEKNNMKAYVADTSAEACEIPERKSAIFNIL